VGTSLPNWRRSSSGGLLHEVRRGWRCLRHRWSSHGVRFVTDERYKGRLPGVPRDELRAERILAFLTEEGLIHQSDIVSPRLPSMRNLLRAHTADYLEALERHEVMLRAFGVPLTDQELDNALLTQRTMVGGTIQATRLSRYNNGVSINLGGGLHHAHRDSGLSFCLFNDVAVAITRMRARGFKAPILVVDLDLHDGNGTRSIFAHDPTVHTYSIHNEHWGDTDVEASTSIALGDRVEDELYLGNVLKTLPNVSDEVEPGFVIYLAGTDPAFDDRLGNWRISPAGMLSRDRFVFDLFRNRRKPIPMIILLAGGYGDESWRYTARFMSYILTGEVIEPPATEELMLMRFQRLQASLKPSALTSDSDDFSWGLSEEDLIDILPGPHVVQAKFLHYFSSHGIELILERLGILDQLRIRGFEHPKVVIDSSMGLGQTLRVFGDRERHELLIELRTDRSTRHKPGFEFITVEWLLLQNPRAEFGPYRRPLPGQDHPGLGMLKEVLGMLVVLCERINLDGVYYVPSTYHVAAQSRKLVRFLEAKDEARFRKLESTLNGMPMAAASTALNSGSLTDKSTGEKLLWEAYPMVLPVSDRFKEIVFSPSYELKVTTALKELETAQIEHTDHQ
jgi:acetoin utilization deacetylase AcuC-like enzyme